MISPKDDNNYKLQVNVNIETATEVLEAFKTLARSPVVRECWRGNGRPLMCHRPCPRSKYPSKESGSWRENDDGIMYAVPGVNPFRPPKQIRYTQ